MTTTPSKTTAIALLFGLAVFFRFYMLGDKLLWHDELATRVFAAGYTVEEWKKALYTGEIFDVAEVQHYQRLNPTRSVTGAIKDLAENDPQHPPLYYILSKIWADLFGDGLATLRALSALLSLLGIPSIFWLSKELFGSQRVAWMSVALYGVSPFFVLYAQEAREYALWIVLILLSNASLLRAIRLTENEEPTTSRRLIGAWALYSLITVVSLYTSFTTASVILSQLAYLCFRERLRPTRVARLAFVSLAVSAIAFVPWFVTLLQHFDAFQVSMKWSREIIIPRDALMRILGHNASRVFVDFWPEITTPLGFATIVITAVFILYAIVTVIRRAPRASSSLLLISIFLPIGMLLVPDLLIGGIRSISMRYLSPSWVFVLLALAFLLGTPPSEAAKKYWVALTAAVLGIAIISTAVNAPKVAVWTKATSVSLPLVAEAINREPSALLVGNFERHNPGNLMALSILLKPGTKMQFLNVIMEEGYVLPRQYGTVFLFGSIGDYRDRMELRENVTTRLLVEDHFLDLRVVDVPAH